MRRGDPQRPACTTEAGAAHSYRPSHIGRACRRWVSCLPMPGLWISNALLHIRVLLNLFPTAALPCPAVPCTLRTPHHTPRTTHAPLAMAIHAFHLPDLPASLNFSLYAQHAHAYVHPHASTYRCIGMSCTLRTHEPTPCTCTWPPHISMPTQVAVVPATSDQSLHYYATITYRHTSACLSPSIYPINLLPMPCTVLTPEPAPCTRTCPPHR